MITLGSLLADLSLHRRTQNLIASHQRILSIVVAPLLLMAGLLIGSYPQEHEEYSTWSLWLYEKFVARTDDLESQSGGSFLVPGGTDPPRRFSSAAIQLSAVAIFLSPVLRNALSHRYLLWLGQHSFAVYLVHGTILRSIGMWVAYGMWPEGYVVQEEEPLQQYTHVRSKASVCYSIVVFVALSYISAWAWMRWVDSACAAAAKKWEAILFAEEEESVVDKTEYELVNNVGNAGSEDPERADCGPRSPALPT